MLTVFAVVCIALLAAALTTEKIGIHAIFGAFLLGAIMLRVVLLAASRRRTSHRAAGLPIAITMVTIPHDSALADDIREKCEDLIVVLFLPVFFAFTGMRTQIGLMKEPKDWLYCVLIIAVASFGKFGGRYLAARWTGSDWREAATLGILLNARGLMELIVLNLGLDRGVLSPRLSTIFVIMAVATTLATTPVLQMLTTEVRTPA